MIRRFCDYCDVNITDYDHINSISMNRYDNSMYSGSPRPSLEHKDEVCDACFDRVYQGVKICKLRNKQNAYN